MSAVPIPDSSRAVNQLVSKVDELAVLPHVVFKVLELSGSSDSAATEMERAIAIDPAFSAKMLAHANSSYYGLSRKVTSIKDAILYLGFKSVREMAMTVGVFDLFVGKNDKESLRRRAWWRHSIDTAVCSRYIATRTGKMNADEAYTCGLLHFLGKMILDRFATGDYEVVERRMNVGGHEMHAEKATFGCDHEEVSVALALKWGLPAPIVAGLHYTSSTNCENAAYGACVALGSSIARCVVEAPADAYTTMPKWALAKLGIPEEDAQDLYDKGLDAITKVAGLTF